MSWQGLNQDLTSFQGALGEQGQRQLDMQQKIEMMKQAHKNEMADEVQLMKEKHDIESKTKTKMFGEALKMLQDAQRGQGRDQGQSQPVQQLQQVQQPQMGEPVMETPSGGQATFGGRIPFGSMAQGVTASSPSIVNPIQPQQFSGQVQNGNPLSGYEMNPNFMFGEGSPFVKNTEKTKSTTLESLGIDTTNGTPEELQAQLEQKSPGYSNFLKGVNEGRLKLGGRGSAVINNVLQDASALYPGLDQSVADARFASRKDYTSGAMSKNITALSTAIHHADTGFGQIDNLDNGKFRRWNTFGNFIKNETGDPRVAVLQSTLDLLNRETNKAISAQVVTNEDKQAFERNLNSAQSKEVAKAVIENYINLLAGRAQPLLEKWQTVFPAEPFNVITPSSQKILQNHGFNWNPQTGDIVRTGQSGSSSNWTQEEIDAEIQRRRSLQR